MTSNDERVLEFVPLRETSIRIPDFDHPVAVDFDAFSRLSRRPHHTKRRQDESRRDHSHAVPHDVPLVSPDCCYEYGRGGKTEER